MELGVAHVLLPVVLLLPGGGGGGGQVGRGVGPADARQRREDRGRRPPG